MKKPRSQILRRKSPEAKQFDAGGRVKRLRRGRPTAAEILSWSEELADIPNQLCSPERPFIRWSIQQLNARLKRKRRWWFLLLSQNQVVVTRMVVLEWLNFPKCLGIILLKVCLESCCVMAKKKTQVFSHMWENCVCISVASGMILIFLTGHHRGSLSWSLLLVSELCPSHQKLVIVISTEIEWCEKSQNISLMLTSRRRSYVSSGTRKVSPSKGQREIWNYRAASVQGWSESCGLVNSVKNHSFSSAPGLSPLCVCCYSWNLSSQTIVLNFFKRT